MMLHDAHGRPMSPCGESRTQAITALYLLALADWHAASKLVSPGRLIAENTRADHDRIMCGRRW